MIKIKKIIILLIRAYQVIPLSMHKTCRFTPSCSNYMIEAINEYGIIKGIKLGLIRLSKCHPHGGYGYDPVIKKGKSI